MQYPDVAGNRGIVTAPFRKEQRRRRLQELRREELRKGSLERTTKKRSSRRINALTPPSPPCNLLQGSLLAEPNRKPRGLKPTLTSLLGRQQMEKRGEYTWRGKQKI